MMGLIYNAQTGQTELVELPNEPDGAPEPVPEQSDAERIAVLEATVAALKEQLDNYQSSP